MSYKNNIKIVDIKKNRNKKLNIKKLNHNSKCKRCGLDYKEKRGGSLCVGERLHKCLRRETTKNNIRAKPQNGSNKDFTLHGKYPRFKQNEGNVTRDLSIINKRSDVSVERIKDGRMTGGKKKKGGSSCGTKKKKMMKKKGGKKGQYTKASLKRVKNATPEYAKKHAKLAKGGKKLSKLVNPIRNTYNLKHPKNKRKGGTTGATGYKKAKNRQARIGRVSVKPKTLKKGGSYKKSKNRQARIDSKKVHPKKPVKDNSRFA